MVIVGWIVFSILAGVIAANKGRSGGGYFILSLFLSPAIGIILAFALPPLVGEIERAQVELGAAKKCPYCAEIVKIDAVICRFCGRDFIPSAPADRMQSDKYDSGNVQITRDGIISNKAKDEDPFLIRTYSENFKQLSPEQIEKEKRQLRNLFIAIGIGLLMFMAYSMWDGRRVETKAAYVEPWSDKTDVSITRVLAENNIRDCGRYMSRYLGHFEYSVKCSIDGKDWKTYSVDTYYKKVK